MGNIKSETRGFMYKKAILYISILNYKNAFSKKFGDPDL